MKSIVLALIALASTASFAAAQGDANAGKALWEGPALFCRNCHGTSGEGAFGPDLAGRKLSVAHFAHAVRKPWGIMPGYVESQISDKEFADLVAYFDGLPAVKTPGKWRFEVPAGAPRGQLVSLNSGCGQCHGPILNGPRSHIGAVNMDFGNFRNLVYNHVSGQTQHVARLGEKMPIRVRMGNYSPTRMWDYQLEEIFNWARDLGPRARIVSRLSAGTAAANGVTYALSVENGALPGLGRTAEDLTIRLIVPNGINVVAATGEGYKGVHMDEKEKANVAEWALPRIAPKDKQAYTITLSKAGTAADNLRGQVRWTKPTVKTGPFDQANIAPAPL